MSTSDLGLSRAHNKQMPLEPYQLAFEHQHLEVTHPSRHRESHRPLSQIVPLEQRNLTLITGTGLVDDSEVALTNVLQFLVYLHIRQPLPLCCQRV
jgi:hypothetical protein